MTVFFLWLAGVIIWNYGFPSVPPIADVIAVVILLIISYYLNRVIK